MAKDTLHIVPHDDSWAIKREGNERVTSTHDTQKEAIESARSLAKEGDNLVIHRSDGTIREQVSVTGSAGERNGSNTATSEKLQPSDVMSVGSRVSWGAVMAGVVVALAVYFTLSLLAFAIGVSAAEQMRTSTITVGAAIVSTICLLVGLYLGGYIASTSTVGEATTEAMTSGVLVWAITLLLLILAGIGLGIGFFGGLKPLGRADDPVMTVDAMKEELGLTEEQAVRYAKVTQRVQSVTASLSPQMLAWAMFAGIVLSMMTAVAGAVVGAGPELVLRRLRGNRVVVLARPS